MNWQSTQSEREQHMVDCDISFQAWKPIRERIDKVIEA
jgi:hypothetical protein